VPDPAICEFVKEWNASHAWPRFVEYLYLVGDNPGDLQRNDPVTLSVGEAGPLVASLQVDSAAPGCQHLRRELRLLAGLGHVELLNIVDKKRIVAREYHQKDGKESLNFAFPFHVPGGTMWLDLPIGAFRPDADQMPGACKNWLTVGRWADVANTEFGVTWVTLDAPLVEAGGITANVLVMALKPSDEGQAWIVRLYGASGRDTEVTLAWARPGSRRTWASDTSERPLREVHGSVPVPAWGVVTLRADRAAE